MSFHRRSFSVVLTAISRVLIFRDHVLGWVGPSSFAQSASISASATPFPAAPACSDAWFVKPAATTPRATVPHLPRNRRDRRALAPRAAPSGIRWSRLAGLLPLFRLRQSATGRVDWIAIRARCHLCLSKLCSASRPAQPIAMLGFSLGSGVAAAVINQDSCRSPDSLRSLYLRFAMPRSP